jgi:hypothetical protein
MDRRSDDRAPHWRIRGGVVTDHLATLRGTRGRLLWRQILLQFLVPLVAAASVVALQFRVTIMTELIAGFSVLAGFLFGLVIFVFQLRLSMSSDPRVQSKLALPRLVDELFSNVLYAVGVSFTLILLSVVSAATEPQLVIVPATDDSEVTVEGLGLDPWVSGIVVLFALHLLAVIGMCIKRTRRAYIELRL